MIIKIFGNPLCRFKALQTVELSNLKIIQVINLYWPMGMRGLGGPRIFPGLYAVVGEWRQFEFLFFAINSNFPSEYMRTTLNVLAGLQIELMTCLLHANSPFSVPRECVTRRVHSLSHGQVTT